MQVNAIIKATASNGKAINTTVSYLRQSQEDKAATLGAALNALTTNTLDSVQVNEINVDTTPTKKVPTLVLGEWQTVTGTTTKRAIITYNGDGVLGSTIGTIATQDEIRTLTVPSGNSGVLYATEGTNYLSAAIQFTVN